MEVEEGHILTHASIDSDHTGLNMATIGCTEDGTLTRNEIEKMPKLKWTKRSSTLYLYGCRTGLPVSGSDANSIADSFFLSQDVKWIVALRGFGYFSYSPTAYQQIADSIDDTRDIYLLAYMRARNVSKFNALTNRYIDWESGDGSLIEPYTRRR
jgi:hypothetical protein